MHKVITILAILIIIAAPVSAGATVEGSIQHYTIDSFVQSRDDPPTGNLFNRTILISNRTGFGIEETQIVATFYYTTVIFHDSAGVWNYTTYWNNTPICSWSLETFGEGQIGEGNGRAHPHIITYCNLETVTIGEHSFRMERTVASGTPTIPAYETISYHLAQEDQLEPDTVNELLDTIAVLAPLIIFIFLLMGAEATPSSTGKMILYLTSIVAGVVATVSIWEPIASLRIAVVASIIFATFRMYESVHLYRNGDE